jgi:glycosyltransferase involved in cell wall biosynthesis
LIEKKSIYILVAAYNEERAIGDVIAGLNRIGYQVVVIDDGSSDKTSEIAAGKGAIVLRHVVNRGKGAALQTGTEYILKKGGKIIVHFDADGQHCPDEIEKLVTPIVTGKAKVVFGSRFLGAAKNLPFIRKVILKLAVAFTNLTLGIKLTDVHNGLRAFSSEIFRSIAFTEDRFAYASELIEKIVEGGVEIKEVPVDITYTDYSMGKGQRNINALQILFRIFLRRYYN